ncbi:Protein of unknown function [Enterobacter sp. kpr-6]|uniref:DUF1202 family protein n=1 Tax=Enterobacter sp. kpr-6 TaxID=1761782 RepID=UPI0008F1D2BD|nr:DUF1202 family protein [Enterobacter sp. kpr-6]SFR09395.1 Protein of unknown function [Enterobacter sp. kpr-6]
MAHGWKYGALLLCCTSFQVLADVSAPPDETLKQQFSEQFGGTMRLESITLRQLDEMGNRVTWMAEGDIAATENLYAMVGMAADYRFYEQTWVKDRPVKFSAMVTSTGTPASGWTTEFFSMQMAAKNAGHTLKDKKEIDLIVTDNDFTARLTKIEDGYEAKKVQLDKWQKEKGQLSAKADALKKKIDTSWTDKNGKPTDRATVERENDEALQKVFNQQGSSVEFKEHYLKTVYEPAVAACQKKPDCDIYPLMAARDKALAEQQQQHSAAPKTLSMKIDAKMAAGDKKVEPLQKEWQEVQGQIGRLNMEMDEVQREYDRWQKDIKGLRERRVIR